MKQKIIFGGPWSANGLTLQVSLCQPNFEPTSPKLSKAMVWVQLHNVPVELLEDEALESITKPIDKLLKVDKFMSSLSSARFAYVCLEIDLVVHLKRGFWLDDEDGKVFFLVLYEQLPTLCYHCGLVRHGTNSFDQRRGSIPTIEAGIAHYGFGVFSDPRVPDREPLLMVMGD